MGSFIGVDLGTTFSAVAMIDDTGRPSIVHDSDGSNITPSCVVEKSDGVMEIGEYARKQWGTAPDTAGARFKRDMGTTVKYTINGREFTPTQLSTFVLKKLLSNAQATIGPVGEAVVTVPANFAHEARDATMAAAKAAELNVKYIINEPTAAALYYAFKSGDGLSGNYAVYDLGGGTFDISVIRVNGQDVDVVTSNGVSRLGGDDFDKILLTLVRENFERLTGKDFDPDDFTMNDAEEEKKSLSKRDSVLARVGRQSVEITRSEFEEAISSLVTQAEMLCEATVDESGVDMADINAVFLVGGSTRIPFVRESVKRIFGKEPTATVNVDEVVALGAALYAAYKGDRSVLSTVQQNAIQKIKVTEATAKCFGTITVTRDSDRNQAKLENTVLIRKNEKIPCSVTQSFYTTHDEQEAVNCQVTESTGPETDPKFVKVISEKPLPLPPGRPANQEIKVTFAYNDNQMMECSFVDVETGRETKISLSMAEAQSPDSDDIEKFTVE